MAKPIRSPVLGFNHNVKYRGRIFHVQTEDSGVSSPRIFTHLYFGGTILASKKHEYDPTAPEDVVRALMQSQHKAILKELKGSRHDGRITSFFHGRGEQLDGPGVDGRAGKALDLDALPGQGGKRAPREDVALGSTFSDNFDDEPTTLDPPEYSAVSSTANVADVIDEISDLPTPPPAAPGNTAAYPTATALAQEALRRRTPKGTPVMGGPVVVQRTVAVGGGEGAGAKPVTRSRRPAQSIPYVVKEGTHPLAETPDPQLDLPLTPAPAATPPRAPAPTEPVADRSLDEVILAYLAGGENDQR
jgi:hypothetical protein